MLDGHRLDDFEGSFGLWSDARVTRHIGGRPSTREEAWGRLHRYPGHWALLGFGYWAVREAQGGRFVGEVGFADHKRGLGPDFDDAPEAGWAMASFVHGQGYATEAMTAALAWGDAQGWRRTVCMIDPRNDASIGVATKLGYGRLRGATYREAPTILFARVRE